MTDIEQSTYDDFVAGIKKLAKGCCEFGQEDACVFLGDAAVLFTDGERVGIGEDDEDFSCRHGGYV